MKLRFLILSMSVVGASVSMADRLCPVIGTSVTHGESGSAAEGTFVCSGQGLAPYYVDVAQYHSDKNNCPGGYCFDVFLIYYKFSSRNVESNRPDSDPVLSFTMITNPAGSKDINYWTVPDFRPLPSRTANENAQASLQMHSQATCFVGAPGKSEFQENGVSVNLTNQRILRIERETADFKYKEVRYVAIDPKNPDKLVVILKEAGRKSSSVAYEKEGAPSIEICQRVSEGDVNNGFSKRKQGGWKAFTASINLLSPRTDGQYGRPEDLLGFGLESEQTKPHTSILAKVNAEYDKNSKQVKIKIVGQKGESVSKSFQLPGGPSMDSFMGFLKKMGFN
jgi:hypothetical protein